MIDLKTAVRYLAEGTRGCEIPVDAQAFRRRLDTHEHLFFGHVPLRAYKHSNRWKFVENDVRQAALTIAALPWAPEDLIDASLLPLHHGPEGPCWPTRPDWRADIRGAIQRAAHRARMDHRCACSGQAPCPQPGPGADGLPCSLNWEELREDHSAYTIACVRPFAGLRWVGDAWLMPRTLVLILDAWQEAQRRLDATPAQCSGCGAGGNVLDWRAATTSGWKILCPACAAASLRPYCGELQGVPYAQVRKRGLSAEGFLCVLCPTPRPASFWDHCHTPGHGLVRGPVCASCNGKERHGKEYLEASGSVRHLLRCDRCREQHTLPQHHWAGAVRRHLHDQAVPEDCEWPRHAEVRLTPRADGGYDYVLHCWTTGSRRGVGTVTAAEARQIISSLVRAADRQ